TLGNELEHLALPLRQDARPLELWRRREPQADRLGKLVISRPLENRLQLLVMVRIRCEQPKQLGPCTISRHKGIDVPGLERNVEGILSRSLSGVRTGKRE